MRKNQHPSTSKIESAFLADIFERLLDLKEKMTLGIDPEQNNLSLLNLHHYLNLRKYDFSQLQDDLTKVGLSSFGRSQAHMEASVNVALEILSIALNKGLPHQKSRLSYEASHAIMDKNAQIFSNIGNKTKIMITVPTDYHENWFSDLSREGAHLFRINTAHDTPDAWSKMAKEIKKVSSEDKDLKIYVDLSGPKIRTSLKKSKKPDKQKKIKVFCGDKIFIHTNDSSPSEIETKQYDAVIGCTLDKVGSLVKVGDPIFLDDGKIELCIDEIFGENIVCSVITHSDEGSKIKDEKGINFPNSDIAVHAICDHDREVLPHICEYADIIGISFTQTPEDITDLTIVRTLLCGNRPVVTEFVK
jgi:pyruvate kinase